MSKQRKVSKVEETKKEVSMSEEAQLESIQVEIDLARKELEKTKFEIEEKKKQLQSSGIDLDESEKEIVAKQISTINRNQSLKEKIEKQKAVDDVPITGKFMNRRAPGNAAKLTYQKYNTDPVKWYTFEDGKVYTIPKGFSDQINEYYHTPKFIEKEAPMDPNKPSSSIHEVDRSNKKYAFVPVGF